MKHFRITIFEYGGGYIGVRGSPMGLNLGVGEVDELIAELRRLQRMVAQKKASETPRNRPAGGWMADSDEEHGDDS